MSIRKSELNRYHRLTRAALSGCAVLFGSSCFAGIPVGELARDLGADAPVYNRSLDDLTLAEAEEAFAECVCPLQPDKVFINLGEADLAQSDFDPQRFLSAYEWLLYIMNNRLKGKTQIYLVSILSAHHAAAAVNEGLARLAEDTGCTYVDITRAAACENTEIRVFEMLRRFLRCHALHFSEAFQISQHALI